MPEELLLEKLERADGVAESLEKVEDALRDARHIVGRIAEKMQGTAIAFEDAWQKTITNVAKGQSEEMHASRPHLLNAFERRLRLLKHAHTLLTRFHNQGWTDLSDPGFLLQEIARMEQLKARVFDLWQSAEDLEDLAARDYPVTTADLDQIGPQRRPPDSWHAENSPAAFDPAVRGEFYRVFDVLPESEAAWTERQATLRTWRADSRFESYWPTIDQILADDFASFRRRAAAMQSVGPWEDYDYDAWRQQRIYDRKHASDHLP